MEQPLGGVVPAKVTVNATGWPGSEGLEVEERLAAIPALVTVWVNVCDPGRYAASPEYITVTVCVPGGRPAIEGDPATLLLSGRGRPTLLVIVVAPPSGLPSMKNDAVPVGMGPEFP